MTVSELRGLVREVISRTKPICQEAFDKDLIDDESYAKDSVLVPDDIKKSIHKWMNSMGMTSRKKPTRSS